jgi:hypothetical protein
VAHDAFLQRSIGTDRHRLELIETDRLQARERLWLRGKHPSNGRHNSHDDDGSRNIRTRPLHGLHPDNDARLRGFLPILRTIGQLAGSTSIVVDDRQFCSISSVERLAPAD